MFGWHFHGIPWYFFIDSAYSKMESQTMFEVTNQTVNPPALSDSLGHSQWWHASMIQNNPERSRCTCTVLSWIDTKPQIFEASAPPQKKRREHIGHGMKLLKDTRGSSKTPKPFHQSWLCQKKGYSNIQWIKLTVLFWGYTKCSGYTKVYPKSLMRHHSYVYNPSPHSYQTPPQETMV